MAKDFQSNVRALVANFAGQFAEQLVELVRTSSMSEVFGSGGSSTPARTVAPATSSAVARRGRPKGSPGRSKVDPIATLAAIADLLAKNADGLRSEQIRDALKLDKATATKALMAGLAAKKVTKKGQKRATRYFAAK